MRKERILFVASCILTSSLIFTACGENSQADESLEESKTVTAVSALSYEEWCETSEFLDNNPNEELALIVWNEESGTGKVYSLIDNTPILTVEENENLILYTSQGRYKFLKSYDEGIVYSYGETIGYDIKLEIGPLDNQPGSIEIIIDVIDGNSGFSVGFSFLLQH